MSWDNSWEKVFTTKEWGHYPTDALIRFIAKNFYEGDRSQNRFLEVGCGPGANVWFMAREGFDVYGIDGSQSAIKKASERLQVEGLKANFQVGDIVSLPFEDNFFDAVIDVECLSCNLRENTKIILAEIQRVLKTGGKLFSKTFTDEVYIGKSRENIGKNEYRNISDGPFSGTGTVRLIDKNEIDELYGATLSVMSTDKVEFSMYNETIKVSEWVIVCQNDK